MALVFVAIPPDYSIRTDFTMINEMINKIGRDKITLEEIEEFFQCLIDAEQDLKKPVKQEIIGVIYDIINQMGWILEPQFEVFKTTPVSAIINVTNSKWKDQIDSVLPKVFDGGEL